jgi:transposase InsO family protein
MVFKVCAFLNVSQRRACRVIGQVRTSQRYIPEVRSEEERLTVEIVNLATRYGRYGYRRITALLNQEGWKVNHKRVERIWRREGLKVPKKQPKRGRLRLNDGSCIRLRPQYKDHVWSYDLMLARTEDGRAFRILTLIDEYTRQCLAILVDRRITSQNVIDQLFHLFIFRGALNTFVLTTAEFTAKAVRRWLKDLGVTTLFIEPGSSWENGYIESFNGKLRDELLNREVFTTLTEAKILIEEWRKEYNQVRPHSALNYRPPAPEAIISLTLT